MSTPKTMIGYSASDRRALKRIESR